MLAQNGNNTHRLTVGGKVADSREGEWCVFPETNRFDALDKRVRALEQDVRVLKKDVIESARIRLQLVATQALLFAAGEATQGYTSFRFQKLLNTPEVNKLSDYTRVLNSQQPMPTTESAVAVMLDMVINTRNVYVHHRDAEAFHKQTIKGLQELLQRHPQLRKECPVEALIVETYGDLRQCFKF